MGCSASVHAGSPTAVPTSSPQTCRALPVGKPLEDWDPEEVEHWFTRLPRVENYRELLLPEDGSVVATIWDKQFLMQQGIPENEAVRIIVYRDKVAARATRPPPQSREAVAAVAAGVSVAAVPFTMAATTTTTATATVTVSQTVLGGTEPTVQAEEGGSRRCSRRSSNPRAVRTPGSRETLAALAKRGLQVVRGAVEKLGPTLPFPGAEAAHLLLLVLDAMDSAVANADNLAALRDRALAVLDVMAVYADQLRGLQRYKEVVGRYRDVLQGILSHAQAYASRNYLVRLLTAGSDSTQLDALAAEVAAAGEDLMQLLALDSNARLQGMEAAVVEARDLLRSAVHFKDPSADARAEVERLGGIEAVLADPTKLGTVLQHLDVTARVTTQAVSSLIQSHFDKGPQRHITQPELRLFWAQHFAGASEVPWFAFWAHFPELMRGLPVELSLVEALSALFAAEEAKVAFQRAVERSNKDTVSVWELKVTFSGDDALLPQVKRLVSGRAAAADGQAAADSGAAAATAAAAAAAPAAAGQLSAAPGTRCQLPPLAASYRGREQEAEEVVSHLMARGSVVLLAPGGMGKSCLAADVGWRLLRAGWALGGALWVDMRGADTAQDVEQRFATSLGLTLESSDNQPRIVTALQRLSVGNGAGLERSPGAGSARGVGAVVVVDNAEDALLRAEAAATLCAMLRKVSSEEGGGTRFLLTSRVPVGGQGGTHLQLMERQVGAISAEAARNVVLAAAEDLDQDQAAQLAEACRCVPLVLQMAAEALTAGRVTLQDIIGVPSSDSGADDATAVSLRVVLASLRKQQQLAAAQLAVLPTAFDDTAAAAVLELPEPQARAMCAVLSRLSVIQRAAGAQQYVMHMLVRKMAAELGGRLDPQLQRRAEARFCMWMTQQLGDWGSMYFNAKEWRLALAAARQHSANISCANALLAAVSEEEAEQVCGAFNENVLTLLDIAQSRGHLRAACRKLLTRLKAVSEPARSQQLAIATTQYILCWSALRAGADKEAEALGRESWKLRAALLGPEHPQTLAVQGLLAACLKACGRLVEAQALHREELEVKRRVLGPDHPGTLWAIGNLACCLKAGGQLAEAEALHREELERKRHVLGDEHPSALVALGNLASCLKAGARLAEAESLHREELELKRRVLGPEHPGTLIALGTLGSCLRQRGQLQESMSLHQEELELKRRVLGPEHPATLVALGTLAKCHENGGRLAEAEALHRQALEVKRRTLGPEHPSTLVSLGALAHCLKLMGQLEESESLHREDVELKRRVLGPEHPAALSAMGNLASCLTAKGELVEAEALHREELALKRQLLGPEHPGTLVALGNLASCITAAGRLDEAEALQREDMELKRRVLGVEHRQTLAAMGALAACLQQGGRLTEAEAVHREELQLKRRVLGNEHPATLAAIGSLASCLAEAGALAEAETLQREEVELKRRVLGPDHPATLAASDRLASRLPGEKEAGV